MRWLKYIRAADDSSVDAHSQAANLNRYTKNKLATGVYCLETLANGAECGAEEGNDNGCDQAAQRRCRSAMEPWASSEFEFGASMSMSDKSAARLATLRFLGRISLRSVR